ncbi:MAG: acyltransferase [Alphaproteobacteria bacterium]
MMRKQDSEAVTKSPLVVGRYYPEIDGLRALAVMIVIYFHSALMAGPDRVAVDAATIWDAGRFYYEFTMIGWCGVDLFFVISGFLITGILMDTANQQKCFRNFYIRRTLRIFPLYYAVLIFSFLLFVLFYGTTFTLRFSLYFLYLQNWFSVFGYDYILYFEHFWSLAIEEQFYIFWPVVFVWAYRRGIVEPVLFVLIFLSFLFRFYLAAKWQLNMAFSITPSRLDGLLLGAGLVYLLSRQDDPRRLNVIFARGMAVSLAAVCLLALLNGNLWGRDREVLMFGIFPVSLFFASFLGWVVTADEEHLIRRFFRLSFLREIGKVSYGMYVYHWLIMCVIVQQEIMNHQGFTFIHTVLLATGAPLSFIVAWTSFRYFEKPFLRLKDVYARYSEADGALPPAKI